MLPISSPELTHPIRRLKTVDDIHLDYLDTVVSTRFLHCTVTVFPFVMSFVERYYEIMQMPCSSLNFQPLVLVSIGGDSSSNGLLQ